MIKKCKHKCFAQEHQDNDKVASILTTPDCVHSLHDLIKPLLFINIDPMLLHLSKREDVTPVLNKRITGNKDDIVFAFFGGSRKRLLTIVQTPNSLNL